MTRSLPHTIVNIAAHICIFSLPVFCGPAQGYASEVPAPTSRRESIIPQSNYWAIAQAVGSLILEVPSPDGGLGTVAVCTVTAISKTLFMTARHCFYDQTGAGISYTKAYVKLGVETEADSENFYTLKPGFVSNYQVSDMVLVESEKPIVQFNSSILKIAPTDPLDSQDLFIIHHPGPGSLVLTRMDCRAATPATQESELHHICDTDSGSSGAPIFDGNFNIVGMHLAGGRKEEELLSYNRGITIKSLANIDVNLKEALDASLGHIGIDKEETKVVLLYKSTFNSTFSKRGDTWEYVAGGDLAHATSLLDQTDNGSGNWIFWDPSRDFVFEFPKNGGTIRARPAASSHWQKLGIVTVVQCPC